MNEQYEILMATARSYLMLAKSLKDKNITYEHYLASAKKCLTMAAEIKSKIDELDNMLEFKAA